MVGQQGILTIATAAGLLLVAGGMTACGDDGGTTAPAAPDSDIVRGQYGLNDGSCYRYRSGNLTVDVTVEGPNTTTIAGRTTYVWTFRRRAGGLADQWYFETDVNGEVRLLRADEGATPAELTQRRYDQTETPPVFYRYEFARDGSVVRAEDVFETTVTPDCQGDGCTQPPGAERHEWAVVNEAEAVTTPDGAETAVRLLYRRTIDGVEESAVFSLVEGKGFAQILAFDGQTYQVCNWRYCDGAGNCSGAASCNEVDIQCL